MYIPPSYVETDLNQLHDLMRAYNFATLASNGHPAPFATHLPFMVDTNAGEHGTLITHMARANPHWKRLQAEEEVLVIFMGPHSYISPRWYAAPSVVPTWNYAAVHAYGRPQVIHEESRLREIVTALADFQEGGVRLPGLDEDFPDDLLKAIVGVEIPIERLEGKAKFSQNRSLEDQQGVVDVLSQSIDTTQQAVAQIMRDNIDQRTRVKEGSS
jgi:transcriptional regulator